MALEELKTALIGRVIVHGDTPDKDKVGRAKAWLAKVDGDMFYVVRGPWKSYFMTEPEIELPFSNRTATRHRLRLFDF